MKKFTPIAMKCNQEQFEAIKPKLNNQCIKSVSNFKDCQYLTNNWMGVKMDITNITADFVLNRGKCYQEVIYETWNEQTFLNACVIETDTYTVSKEFILDLHENVIWPSVRTKIENEFPELFPKPKTKLTISEIEAKLGYEIEIVK